MKTNSENKWHEMAFEQSRYERIETEASQRTMWVSRSKRPFEGDCVLGLMKQTGCFFASVQLGRRNKNIQNQSEK